MQVAVVMGLQSKLWRKESFISAQNDCETGSTCQQRLTLDKRPKRLCRKRFTNLK